VTFFLPSSSSCAKGAPPLNEKGLLAAGVSGQSVVVAHLPSKERARVRFPLAAPRRPRRHNACKARAAERRPPAFQAGRRASLRLLRHHLPSQLAELELLVSSEGPRTFGPAVVGSNPAPALQNRCEDANSAPYARQRHIRTRPSQTAFCCSIRNPQRASKASKSLLTKSLKNFDS
jgi:hypothetical protein